MWSVYAGVGLFQVDVSECDNLQQHGGQVHIITYPIRDFGQITSTLSGLVLWLAFDWL